MKLLIVGIDGGDREIISAMPMPFLKKLLENSTSYQVEEDLFSRGWPEILCGEHGIRTGAFYTKPERASQSSAVVATQSFKVTDYEKVGVEPLWKVLNQNGLTIGFMNVPTTYPAPKVNGFFVSGAGGGLGEVGIPEGACYPADVAQVLEEEGYIFDTRFMSSGIRDRGLFINRLITMTRRRVNAFKRLVEKYRPEVGFVAFMGLRCIQYLAMQEIQAIKEAVAQQQPLTKGQLEIAELYADFDRQVQKLVERLKPAAVMLVSDHGQAEYKHQVDVGAFLKKHGWQIDKPKRPINLKRTIKRLARLLLPSDTVNKLKKTSIGALAAERSNPVDMQKSAAFGMRYVPGVYINDERFGGAVRGEQERVNLMAEIIDAFNKDPIAIQFEMKARPYYESEKAHPTVRDQLPDIWIDHPDTVFFEYGIGQTQDSGNIFVGENPAYGQPIVWSEVSRDQWTGVKGRHPLLAVHGCNDGLTELNGLENNLTDAYRIALSVCLK